jgi:anti-sigma regulatory factor (Ser/Thr protein kinase)
VPSAQQTFVPSPDSVRGCRRFVAGALSSWGLEDVEDDARSVVSELATNAVLHARTEFTLSLSTDGELLRVVVTDDSPYRPRSRSHSDPEATTGRGLMLVGLLSSDWGVEPHGHGKSVWCELLVSPEGPGDGASDPGDRNPGRADASGVDGGPRERPEAWSGSDGSTLLAA